MANASNDFVLAGTGDDRQAERTVLQRRDRQAHGRQAGVARDRSQGERGVIEAACGFVAQEAQRRDRRRRGQHEKRSRWQQLPQANCRLRTPGIPSRADGRIERTHAVETRLDGRTEDRIAAQEIAVLADDVETLQRHVRLEEVGRPAGEDLHFFENTHRLLSHPSEQPPPRARPAQRRRWPTATGQAVAMPTAFRAGTVHQAADARRRGRAGRPCRSSARSGRRRPARRGHGWDASRTGRRSSRERAAEPPVSVPRPRSARPAATATAEPLDEPPGRRSGARGFDRRAVMLVLAFQAEGEFVGDRLADQGRAGAQQAIDGERRLRRRLLSAGPMRIAAAGHVSGDVQKVLGDEGEAVERARSQRRQACPGTGNEGAVVVHLSALRIVSVGAVQPTMPPWARIMARVAALNSGK